MSTKSAPRIAVYAGSFDPPTNGHLWVIERGADMFDELIVAIGQNSVKNPTFTDEERVKMLQEATAHLKKVRITLFNNEYLVHFAARMGAQFILRGVRNVGDFSYEQTLRLLNADLAPEITTVLLMPPRALAEVSSSTVKMLIGPKGWEKEVKRYVPPGVLKALKQKK